MTMNARKAQPRVLNLTSRTDGRTDRQTDGRTDGRTTGILCLTQTSFAEDKKEC